MLGKYPQGISNDERTNNQLDHVLIDGKLFSNILGIRTMRVPDIGNFPIKAKLRTRISTQQTQTSNI